MNFKPDQAGRPYRALALHWLLYYYLLLHSLTLAKPVGLMPQINHTFCVSLYWWSPQISEWGVGEQFYIP